MDMMGHEAIAERAQAVEPSVMPEQLEVDCAVGVRIQNDAACVAAIE
jgi:hypothetical protein